MSVNSTFDVDSVGGGVPGGMGFNNNSILWLLLLLRNGGLDGNSGEKGYVAGKMQSDIDCLSKGQGNIEEMIRQVNDNARFEGLNGQLSELSAIQRDATAAITAQNNDLSRQFADCCCDLKVGQQAIRTDIAMQTCDINQNTNNGIQRVVDLITTNLVEQKNDRIRELEQSSQTATIAAIVRDTCAPQSCSGGNTIDINVLAAALAGRGATVSAPTA